MRVMVAVKRLVDCNVKIRVEPGGSGVDLADVKTSVNAVDEIDLEEAGFQNRRGRSGSMGKPRLSGSATTVLSATCPRTPRSLRPPLSKRRFQSFRLSHPLIF
jgi:electron transfer flavoprotein alpha/beta subunit